MGRILLLSGVLATLVACGGSSSSSDTTTATASPTAVATTPAAGGGSSTTGSTTTASAAVTTAAASASTAGGGNIDELKAAARKAATDVIALRFANVYRVLSDDCRAKVPEAEFALALAKGEALLAGFLGGSTDGMKVVKVETRNVTATSAEVQVTYDYGRRLPEGVRLGGEWDHWVFEHGAWRSAECADLAK